VKIKKKQCKTILPIKIKKLASNLDKKSNNILPLRTSFVELVGS
jgi:hypothetical protein